MVSRCAAMPLRALALVLLAVTPLRAAEEGAFVQGRIVLPDITLIDHHAEAHRLRDDLARGALIVMTFSYTTCDSICPIGNDIMAQLDADLGAVDGREVRLLSVTIDPSHDTPAVMAKAAREFEASARWYWLTGRPGDIRRLLRSVGAPLNGLEFHDPVFVVGDPESGVFYRTQTMPAPGDLIAMLESLPG